MVDGEHADAEPRDARYGTHWRESIILADRQALLGQNLRQHSFFLTFLPWLGWNAVMASCGERARDGIAEIPQVVVTQPLIHS